MQGIVLTKIALMLPVVGMVLAPAVASAANNELGQTRGAPKWYGMSEDAAGVVDGWFAAHGYRVSADTDGVWLGNVEAGANGATWSPDIIDPSHRWQNDGYASMI